jgi:hypothetical protein
MKAMYMTNNYDSVKVDLNDEYAIDADALRKDSCDVNCTYLPAIERKIASIIDDLNETDCLVTGIRITFEGLKGDLEIANFDQKHMENFIKLGIDVRINIHWKDYSCSVSARCDFRALFDSSGTYDDNGDDDGQEDLSLSILISSPLVALLEQLSSPHN